ncbi:MAG: PEP-CTERM sorting domain-containing protein [Nodularia sp. CChRGM 3473]
MKINSFFPATLVAAGVAIATSAMPASAVTVGFQNIFPNDGNTNGDAFVNNFSFDVIDAGSSQVLFNFSNSGPGVVREVAFSVNNAVTGLLSNIQVNVGNVGNVNFSSPAPGVLPQSENITGWNGSTFSAVATPPPTQRGIASGESLGVRFNADFNAVIAALTNRQLQVGIHVISFPNGGSDAFVNANPPGNPTPVPEPITTLGFGVGVAGASLLKWKYGNKEMKKKATV